MNRRSLLAGAAGAGAAAAARRRRAGAQATPVASEPPALPATPRELDFSPFESALAEMTEWRRHELDALILEEPFSGLQRRMDAGDLSSGDLVLYYLDRIRRLDAGRFRSVLELNPDALLQARQRDLDRRSGESRGLLHGLPLLLKDVIGSGENLGTAAGAAALAGARTDRDPRLVGALREAGAIVLGKANLSEWSYWMAWYAPSGFSALGGQVVSPYGADLDPLGSSTGSAVAATCSFAAASIGTETFGSIIAPSSVASVVGVYPTPGLVSRDRTLPISHEMDSPGPIARSVSDAAALLTIMAAEPDLDDPLVRQAWGLHGVDFSQRLDRDALRGKRIGVLGDGTEAGLTAQELPRWLGLAETAEVLADLGATVTPVLAPPFALAGPGFEPMLNRTMRDGVEAYLSATGAPVRTIEEIVRFNLQDPARLAPYGQERLIACSGAALPAAEARAIAEGNRRQARRYIGRIMGENQLDAVIGPDNIHALIYPFAALPAITVPGGRSVGEVPFGVTFFGPPRGDAEVFGYAFAFEQATRWRIPPRFGV